MGLFDRKKEGGLMDVIRCDETAYLVWKWRPSGEANSTRKENSIRYGSSLRVKQGEVAVFVYQQQNGQMMDFLVGPYDGTIKTSNFPVLTSIVGTAFGGNSPFQAEIYFINLQGNNQIKFAVPYFDVSDPRLPDYPVPVSIHATLTFSLENYERFINLNRMIDFDLDAFYRQIKDAMVRKIKSVVTNIPYDYGLPVIQLERKTDQISEIIEEKLRDRLEEFGVTMKHIDINSIDIDKDSEMYQELKSVTGGITASAIRTQAEINEQNLRNTAELNAINMAETMRIQREEAQRAQKLQTESNFIGAHALNQQTEVLKTAAEGLGQMNMNLGGGADGGFNPAGMMMGMALGGSMGGQINNMMNQMGQQMNTSMNTPPPLPQTQYMLAENGQQFGPFTIQQMTQLVQSGRMTKQTYAWKQGMPGWEPAGNIGELAVLFAPAAPPPVPGGMPTPPPPPSI
jgi:membrane protease subunit (stomatin/prohibitin family)